MTKNAKECEDFLVLKILYCKEAGDARKIIKEYNIDATLHAPIDYKKTREERIADEMRHDPRF